MSYVDELLAAYRRFVSLPWQQNLAAASAGMDGGVPAGARAPRTTAPAGVQGSDQRAPATLGRSSTSRRRSRRGWRTTTYRDAYFEDPDLLETALPGFFDHLVEHVRVAARRPPRAERRRRLLGAGTLFGLGDAVKVSALLNAVNDAIAGRLLVFFPGEHEGNSYRLLDARDGWNYLAIPITPNGSGR